VAVSQTAVPTGNQEVQKQTLHANLVTLQKTALLADQDLLTIVHQDQTTEPKDVSGQTSHVTARVSQTVQPKRAGQISLLTQTENLLTLETQDLLNPGDTKQEDHASQQDHLIAALVQDQALDTDQIRLIAQLAMIVASAQIVQPVISQAIRSAALQETLIGNPQETRQELTSHAQTRESMTATAILTAKTECQETSLVTQALLALATRTQTAKHSLRTRF
jgi:hypothetical protein